MPSVSSTAKVSGGDWRKTAYIMFYFVLSEAYNLLVMILVLNKMLNSPLTHFGCFLPMICYEDGHIDDVIIGNIFILMSYTSILCK